MRSWPVGTSNRGARLEMLINGIRCAELKAETTVVK
jgi:hypothetical protein